MVLYLITVFITTCLIVLKYVLMKNHDYWKKKNVPHLKPLPLFGNHKETILLKKHITQVVQEICQLFPEEPYIGTLYGTRPALVVQDPDLIKSVLSKDFYYFSGRDVSDYSHKEPVTKNLFFSGGNNWKVQRQNLTPLFSSSKIRGMFYLIKNCAKNLELLLEKETKDLSHIGAKSLFARYMIDCITTCGFGFDPNTMNVNGTTNPFLIIGEKIFDKSAIRGLKWHLRTIWPTLFYSFKLRLFEKNITSFFHKLITDIFVNRQTGMSSRNDFVDLILTWKQNNQISGFSLCNPKCPDKKVVSLDVNNDLLVAQCILFFGAGYETTATTMTFLLYELAKNPEIQEKVIKEIDIYYEKFKGAIEYECINELPYLESCIEESLRLYPVLGVITRDVMEDYTFPTGLRIRKGDLIHIPVGHIHRHPNYFPESEQFCPERFYGEERKNIKPFTFMPFGEGSRTCIGQRFSKMPMYAALLTIFKNYRVELAKDMPRDVKFETTAFVISPVCEINLKFISRIK